MLFELEDQIGACSIACLVLLPLSTASATYHHDFDAINEISTPSTAKGAAKFIEP